MEQFDEMLAEEHKIRIREEQYNYLKRQLNGENEYIRFCVWCNAYNKSQGKNDYMIFKKYLEEEKVELNFWQKKHLAETYFGFEFEWTGEKWSVRKKIKVPS